jgi:hypothetical protein
MQEGLKGSRGTTRATKMAAAHANADLTELDFMGIPRDVRFVIYDKARNILLEERKEIKKMFREQIHPWIQMNSYRQTCTEIEGCSTPSLKLLLQRYLISYQSHRMDRLLQVPRNGPCKLTIFIDDEFTSDEGFFRSYTYIRSLVYEGEQALLGFPNDDKIDLHNPHDEY